MNPVNIMPAWEIIAWVLVPAITVGYGILRLARKKRQRELSPTIFR